MKKIIKFVLIIAALALSYGGYLGYMSLQDYFCWNCKPEGIYNRGIRFLQDPGEKSADHGLALINSASEQGYAEAQIFLAEVYLQTFPPTYIIQYPEAVERLKAKVPMNPDLAVSYYATLINNSAVSKGQYKAMQYNLALLLKTGIVQKTKYGSRHWFTLAAQHGDMEAMLELGRSYHAEGDYAAAHQWFSSAFDANRQPEAAMMIGDYYLYGKGVEKEIPKAIQWYEKAQGILAGADDPAADPHIKLIAESAAFKIDIAKRKHLDLIKEQQTPEIAYRVEGDLSAVAVFVLGKEGELHIGYVEKKDGRFWAKPLPSSGQALSSEAIKAASLNEGVILILENYAFNAFEQDKNYRFILKP